MNRSVSHPAKALLIKAKGGLGNRMLSAVTGIVLARLNRREPIIDWRDGMYVPAGTNLYPLLFDSKLVGDPGQFDHCTDVAPAIWSGRMALHPVDVIEREYPRHHQDPLIYRRLSIDLTGADPACAAAVFWSYLPKLRRLQRRMASSAEFSGKSLDQVTGELLDACFTPVAEVREAVDRLFAGLTGPSIGVHIRYTDRKTPLPRLLDSLALLRRDHPEANIFLATDSAVAQEAVNQRFAGVVSIAKHLPQGGEALHVTADRSADQLGEARNALIDMIALSRCDWLVHSSHSTFSVTAALIGRIPKARQIDVDRRNPSVRIKQFLQARL